MGDWDDLFPEEDKSKLGKQATKEIPLQKEVLVQEKKPEPSPVTKQVIQEEISKSQQKPSDALGELFGGTINSAQGSQQQLLQQASQQSQSPPASEPQKLPTSQNIISATDFDMSEAEHSPHLIITIWADKGVGKTFLAMSLPGKKAVLSYDKAAMPIKEEFYNNDPDIKVYDGIRYYDESDPAIKLSSAVKCFEYSRFILTELKKNKPDWIVFDAAEALSELCEMVMRSRNSFMPFQGFSNRVLWRERNMYMNQLHKMALEACNKGLAYTVYPNMETLAMKDADVIEGVKGPKWVGSMKKQTHVVIYLEAVEEKNRGRRYIATVQSSKKKQFLSGSKTDITDSGFKALGLT